MPYCVNVMVDIKPIYLNKRYLFLKKIYYLGGDYMIPFCRDEILSRFAGITAV